MNPQEILWGLEPQSTQLCSFSWEAPLHWCRIKCWMSGQSPPPKKLLFLQCADWNQALSVPAVLPYTCRLQLFCKMRSDPQLHLLRTSFFSRAMNSVCVEMFLWPGLDCLAYERSAVLKPMALLVWWATIPFLLVLSYSVSADTKLICYALSVPWWLQCWLVSRGPAGQGKQARKKHPGQYRCEECSQQFQNKNKVTFNSVSTHSSVQGQWLSFCDIRNTCRNELQGRGSAGWARDRSIARVAVLVPVSWDAFTWDARMHP